MSQLAPAPAISSSLPAELTEFIGRRHGHERLTRREQQVAELVATGLTNQDIASKLTLSRRTVEGHVEKALTKLGFTSRTQLAVWVSDQSKS